MAILDIFSPYPSNLNCLIVQTCPVERAQGHLYSVKLWKELLGFFSDNSYVIPLLRYWINPMFWGRIRWIEGLWDKKTRKIWELLEYNHTQIMWQFSVDESLLQRHKNLLALHQHILPPFLWCTAEGICSHGPWKMNRKQNCCVSHINKAFYWRSTWNIGQSVSHYQSKRWLIITKFL